MDVPPLAPMPPPPPGFHQQAGHPPPGAIPVDDIFPRGHQGRDPYDDVMQPMEIFPEGMQGNKAGKKGGKDDANKKKKDEEKKPIESSFAGYVLERAEPLPGQKSSWARVGKRPLPVDEAKLLAIVKQHRARTKTMPTDDLLDLTPNQRGVVSRLVAEHQSNEKNSRADWTLVDLQRFGTWKWRSLDVRAIQIVLKRYDREAMKPISKGSAKISSYQSGEIIDLAEPVKKPQKETAAKGKKGGNAGKDYEAEHGYHDDHGIQVVDVGHDRAHPQAQGHHDRNPWDPLPRQQHPQAFDHFNPMQHALPPPPPGAIPINQFHHPGQPMNPFEPEYNPGAYDPRFEPLPERQSARIRMRSPSPHQNQVRRRSQSRHSLREKRRLKRLEGKVDEVLEKFDNWHLSGGEDSSEGAYDEDSIFSPPPSGGSFTPPSTPPRSEYDRPMGSLNNHGKSPGRYLGERRGSRHRRYGREMYELEPGHGPGRDRRLGDVRYAGGQHPRLHRAHTYDDYPMARGREARYLAAPRRQGRLLMDHAEGYDDALFDDGFGRRRRDDHRRVVDPVREVLEVRREAPRYARRNSYVGGGARPNYWQ